jgi:ferrous iron transport protein A
MKTRLLDLADGKSGTVVGIAGGHGIRCRLLGLGIREGVEIAVICAARGHGPAVVGIGRNRVAIGHGMAAKIAVEETTT